MAQRLSHAGPDGWCRWFVYFDPDAIRRKGDLVKMWVLYDYKTIQTKVEGSYLSSRVQKQFNCAESASSRLPLHGSLAIWDTIMWFSTTPAKASGNQLH